MVAFNNCCGVQLKQEGGKMEIEMQKKILRENIRLLVKKLEFLNKSEASCCGITLSQCYTLVEVGRAEKLSLNELSQIVELDKSTMSRTIENMVSSGLVEREIDAKDRRYVQIKLTDKGVHAYEEIESNMETFFKSVIERIPEEKRDQVVESMGYLLKAIPGKCC